MTNRLFGQPVRWSSGALLGLLLTFAFLGHDLLMAGDAHHATAATSHGTDRHDTAMGHAGEPIAGTNLPHATTMAEHDGCGYFGLAVYPSNDPDAPDPRDQTIFGALSIDAGSTPAPVEPPEPTAPPGVRRALLQVFRI